MSMPAATETTTHGSKNDREIVDAKVIVTCPGRNFVTLKITTRSGVYGLGDATLNGRELAVASYLQDHVVPNLIGRDAGRIAGGDQQFRALRRQHLRGREADPRRGADHQHPSSRIA